LHARRSHSSIVSFRRHNPNAPVIVALTGTDIYRDIPSNHLARKSLQIATRIVVLQPKAIDELQPSLQDKTRVIYQSVDGTRDAASGRTAKMRVRKPERRKQFSGNFDVCVIGHLRPVKDPFRTAMAARLLPPSSRIRSSEQAFRRTRTILPHFPITMSTIVMSPHAEVEIMMPKAERKRCAWPADLNRLITRFRSLVG
jgi:hypothetical protein